MARDPLAPLRRRADRTTRRQLIALRRAHAAVRAEILNASRQASMATSARERESLYRAIAGHYLRLEKGIDEQLRGLVGDAARYGADTAGRDARGKRLVEFDGQRLERYWSYVRPGNGQSLAAVFTQRMTDTAIDRLRAAFLDTYRQGAVEGWTAAETQKRMQAAWDGLAGDEDAFRFVDRSGRRWENARYLQMLHQTTAMRVMRDSYIDRLTESGFNLARISDDGDPDCPICEAWEGQIVQLSGKSRKYPTWAEALEAGVGHPNCIHRPEYVDELADKDEIERQGAVGRVDPDDRDAVQARKDKIDIAAKRAEGLRGDDARRAVAMDRAARMILAGTFSEAAAEAARQLPAEILDRIMQEGTPHFELIKKGQEEGWNHGRAGGVVRVPRDPSSEDVLRAMGVRPHSTVAAKSDPAYTSEMTPPVTAAIDRAYMAAVESGNMAAAQRMADEALARSSPTRKVSTERYPNATPVLFTDERGDTLLPSARVQNGMVEIIAPSTGWGHFPPDTHQSEYPHLFRVVDDAIKPLGDGVFVRMTNSADDYKHLARGTHRGSLNRAQKLDGMQPEHEGGLSVAHQIEFPARYGYLVTGRVIGQGADGEPLLDTTSARPISDNLTNSEIHDEVRTRTHRTLDEKGITREFYSGVRMYVRAERYLTLLDIPRPAAIVRDESDHVVALSARFNLSPNK